MRHTVRKSAHFAMSYPLVALAFAVMIAGVTQSVLGQHAMSFGICNNGNNGNNSNNNNNGNNNNNDNNSGNNGNASRVFVNRAVGGIAINADGVLNNMDLDTLGKLAKSRQKAAEAVPENLRAATDLRKVSLRGLAATLEDCYRSRPKKRVPDAVLYLGGLQQIRYVFVYPEQNDIVLVGPGDAWTIDSRDNVVGATNGRAVMLLDDLLIALRSAREAARGGISCSIDPTKEGLQRLAEFVAQQRTVGNPRTTASRIEHSLGTQQITFSGVPVDSHFARVLLAADYRMKRLAMDFDPAPIRGLPSFMQMAAAGPRGMNSMAPRWWLEPKYDALLRDADGLAWELRGGSVKAMTEEDLISAGGDREHTGKADPIARQWADNMTAKYDELAMADPTFGQLRNCMELAIVAALVTKEELTEKAHNPLPALMGSDMIATDSYAVPKSVDSKASLRRKGHDWVIITSGGVSIRSWDIAGTAQQNDAPATARKEATSAAGGKWCWD